MSTIPASQLVNVNPSVLSAAGTGLELIGLLLTNSTRIPIGTVQEFPDADAVSTYFGAASDEAALAPIYFNGFEGRTKTPGSVLMAQYNDADVAAFLRGGDVSGFSLSELQAISGSLTLVVDGYTRVDASIDLSGATSFSAAAAQIESEINAAITQEAAFTASISGTTMTVTAVSSGALGAGQTVAGGTVDAGTYIVQQLTGTEGDTGTYEVSVSQTEGSGSLTSSGTDVTVTYDTTSGGFLITSGVVGAISTIAFPTGTLAPLLYLTEATGAVVSQGADQASPVTFMNALIAVNRAWATFTTTFDPDSSGNTNKIAFSAWTNSQNNLFAYFPWDTDVTPTTTNPATTSLGYLIAQASYSGIAPIWAPDAEKAVFACGAVASIDFSATNGRSTLAYKRQDGLVGDVTDGTVSQNLIDNGYNFYGAYGSRANPFIDFQNGQLSGDFAWIDSYVNQIWFNDAAQVALLSFLENAKSVPFSAAGYAQIEAALQDTIDQAITFGMIEPGSISSAQVVIVNSAAGIDISDTLQTSGYYVQVVNPSSAIRAARGPLTVNLWYLDRGSVQKITLNSIAVQ